MHVAPYSMTDLWTEINQYGTDAIEGDACHNAEICAEIWANLRLLKIRADNTCWDRQPLKMTIL